MKKIFNILRVVLIGMIVVYPIFSFIKIKDVEAASIVVTISPDSVATSNASDKIISFVPVTGMNNGSYITINYDSAYDDTGLNDAAIAVTKTGDSNFVSSAETVDTDNNYIVCTLTTSGVLDTTNKFDITITGSSFEAPSVAANYTFSVTTSVGDFGAVLQYVGDDNDVLVTAMVQPVMAFNIRNSSDTGDANTCSLGVLGLTSVNTCAYRLKVTTNASGGYAVQLTSDGDLRKNGSGDVSDADDIDLIGESVVTAGTEGYGVALVGGSATGGVVTESGNFSSDDSSIPMSFTNLYTSNGGNNPASTDTTNTALITHRAAIDGDTITGNYTQIVTYTVSATF